MEGMQIVVGISVLPSLLCAEMQCSEVPAHRPTTGSGAGVRAWDLVPSGLFWAFFSVDDLCGVTRHGICPPWGGLPSTLPSPVVETPRDLNHILKVLVSSFFLFETGSWRNLLLILVLP